MEDIKEEVNIPKDNEKKTWQKPKLYWGKEIGFMPLLGTGPGTNYTPSY